MEAHHTMDSLKKAMPVRVQITAILRKALFSGEYKSGDELSLTETAERLGVSRQAVSKWENGTSEPNTSNLMALARLYGIPAEDLLKGVESALEAEGK